MIRRLFRRSRGATSPVQPALPTSYYVVRSLLITVVGVAFTAVAYSVFWFYAATEMREGVANWFADRRVEGFAANYQRLEISGFPTVLRVLLTRPTFGRGRPADDPQPEDWRWEGQSLVAEGRPWSIRRISIEITGNQRVSFFSGLRRLEFSGKLERLGADLAFHDDGLPRVASVDLTKLNMKTADRRLTVSAATASIRLRRLLPDAPTEKTPTIDLSLDGTNIVIPRLWRLPLGYQLPKLVLRANVLGAVPAAPLGVALAGWRDKGGTVEVVEFDTRYGPLRARASGTVALDASLQPIGALTARLQGFFPAIDALRKAKLIRSRDAAMAKVVLGALSRRSTKGGPRVISLPLSVQRQTLYAGPAPLIRIPSIDWGQAPQSRRGR